MKRTLSLVSIVLIFALMFTGAGSFVYAQNGLSDEIITVAVQGEPNSLVPDVAFLGNYISSINRLVYEPLVIADYQTLELYDTGLVTDWQMIDDTNYRLTLREGVKFHNGEEFTAEDVLYQFQQGALGAQTDHYGLFHIPKFKVEDDYNIIIATKEPWAQAIELLSFNTMMAVSKTELEAAGGAKTTRQYLENAGTGKYRFKEWVPGEYILLERNEDYWDQDNLGYFKGFKFVFVSDIIARALAVQSGDADVALDASMANYRIYDADPTINAQLLNTNTVSTLFLNSGAGGPLGDVRVREAIYWLVDKNIIRAIGNSGFGRIADTLISPDSPMFDGIVESENKKVDVARAKKLLAEAGYPNGLSLKMRSNSESEITSLIQEQLRQGGINVVMELAEMPVHFEGLARGDFDMYVSSQQFGYYTETVRTLDGIKYDYRDVMGGSGYKNEEFSAIAARAYAAVDMDERRDAYAELQQHVRENYASIGLYTNVGLLVSRSDLEGFELFGVGVVDMSNLTSLKQ